MRGKINKSAVEALNPGEMLVDDECRGFAARCLPSGTVQYVLRYRLRDSGKRRWLALGVHGEVTPDQARLEAERQRGAIADRRDPLRERQEERAKVAGATTVGAVVSRYLDDRKSELRPRTHEEYRRHLEDHWKPLAKRPIIEIGRADVVAVLDDIARENGKVAADRARAALSAFFIWATDRGYVVERPWQKIKKRSSGDPGSRVLSETELVEVWKASGDDDYGTIIKLLILSGQRKSEIGDLAFSEINSGKRQVEIPIARCKNHKAMRRLNLDGHIVPLSDQASAIIEGIERRADRKFVFGRLDTGFSGWSRCKARLDKRIAANRKKGRIKDAMPDWDVHDIRRSVATHLAESRVRPGKDGKDEAYSFAQPHVVEAILNHLDAKGGVVGTYNKATYLSERRQVLDIWGKHIEALVTGHASNVIPLPQRRESA